MRDAAPRGGFYLPALDGIRGLAFLLVFLLHAAFSCSQGTDLSRAPALALGLMDSGRYGVSLFFVLSAFLVTSLLLRERERFGSVDVGAFVVRRGLRIWPLYFLILIAYAVKGRLPFTGTLEMPWLHVVAYATFMGDLLHMWTARGMLTHLWSIGVEEKFYLAWPWALRRAGRVGLVRIVVGVIALQWILRLALPPFAPFRWFLYGPIAYLDCFALGAGIALLPSGWKPPRIAPAAALGGFLLAVVGGAALGFAIDGPAQEGWGFPLAQGIAATAGAALVAVLKDRLDGWPVWPPLVEVGKRSYGAYLIHAPLLGASARFAPPGFGPGAVAVRVAVLALTLGLAWLSFRFFERPFLRLKSRFQRVPSGAR